MSVRNLGGHDDETVAFLCELERRRCAAIGARDWETLRGLLLDSYLHVHTDGVLEDRDGWLSALDKVAERRSEREDLQVQLLTANVALMCGIIVTTARLEPTSPRLRVRGIATQTWIGASGAWRLAHFQVTAVQPPEVLDG
jgi:Domain of unknown function (DUF4440)